MDDALGGIVVAVGRLIEAPFHVRKKSVSTTDLFHPLNIDWSSGWDEGEDMGASDFITEMLEEYNPGSKLFEDYDHYCIDFSCLDICHHNH